MRQFSLLFSIFISTISVLSIQSAEAQNRRIPKPSEDELKLDLLTNTPDNIITADTVYQKKLTVPSLWWAQEQSENKLLDNWIAFPQTDTEPARVDLIVNEQVWNPLDYLERYNFVNRMGTVARKNGYNIRVFNYEKERLATYTCNFNLRKNLCNININATGLFK